MASKPRSLGRILSECLQCSVLQQLLSENGYQIFSASSFKKTYLEAIHHTCQSRSSPYSLPRCLAFSMHRKAPMQSILNRELGRLQRIYVIGLLKTGYPASNCRNYSRGRTSVSEDDDKDENFLKKLLDEDDDKDFLKKLRKEIDEYYEFIYSSDSVEIDSDIDEDDSDDASDEE